MQENQQEDQINEIEKQLSGENPEEQEGLQSGDNGAGGDATEEKETAPAAEIIEEDSPNLTNDGLEIPTPDIKPESNEDFIALRIKKKKEREERRLESLQEEQIKKDQNEIIRLRVEQAATQAAMSAPSRDDFSTDTDFVEATVNYTIAKKHIQSEVEREARDKFAAQQRLYKNVEETKNKGAAKYSDFEEVVSPLFEQGGDIPTNLPLAEAISDSKYGDDILYMLGRNKKKAIEIASMSPIKALKWLWETEGQFERVHSKVKQTTSAPLKAMAKIVSKSTPHKDVGSMTTKEYKEYWKRTRFSN